MLIVQLRAWFLVVAVQPQWWSESLRWLKDNHDALDIVHKVVGLLVGLIVAGWALYLYSESKKKDTSDWLNKLFSNFYLSPEFRKLRMFLEFGYSEKLCPVVERVLVDGNARFDEPDEELLCDLDTALNYFEFMLHLEKMGRLGRKDRQALFKYWYDLLADPELASLRIYVRRFGYEGISDVLQAQDLTHRYGEWVAFYGSLMKGQGVQEELLIDKKLKRVRSCSIPGTLYDLGKYPGLVKGNSVVPGELYELADKRALSSVFEKLDAYEEFDPMRPDKSLFVRRAVRLIEPKVDCWVYFFCGDVSSHERIEGMSWTEYKNSMGGRQ